MKKGLALLTTLGLAITGCTTNVFAADVVIKLADVQAENDVETQFDGSTVWIYADDQNKSIMACRCRCFFNESYCASFRV